MLLYVAGKYRGPTPEAVADNVTVAEREAGVLWLRGHTVICPHANTRWMDTMQVGRHKEQGTVADALGFERIIAGDLEMLARCDGIVMLQGWEESEGARIEHDFAVSHGIPIWYSPDMPDLHPTEVRCPKQVGAFRDVVMQMYRVHLDKNADYSPANILATGELGLVTRLWDKTARLMNLTGFRFEISKWWFEEKRQPKNEAIDDTYVDGANYNVIGLLLRRGQWGK